MTTPGGTGTTFVTRKLETSSVLVATASPRRVGVPWLLAPALRFAPSQSPKSVGRIAPSFGYYGVCKQMFVAGEHPQSCISIHRCYKRYRGGAMQGAWSGCFQGYRGEAMHYLGYELPRTPVPRSTVNKAQNSLFAATPTSVRKVVGCIRCMHPQRQAYRVYGRNHARNCRSRCSFHPFLT